MLEKGPSRVSPLLIPMNMPNGPAAYVGLEIGARAGVHTPVSACASGAEAIALRARPDPARPRRRRRRRRHRGLHPPAHHRRLRADAGDVARATTSRARVPAVRQGARRLRARRGRRRAGARASARSRPRVAGRRTPCSAGPAITSDSYDIVAPDPAGNGQMRAAQFALERVRRRPRPTSCTSTRTPRRPRPATAPRRGGSPTCSASRPSSRRPSR